MSENILAILKRKKYYLLNKLKNSGHFIRGSITTIKHKCGNSNCECNFSDAKKHPGIYFSANINGKTKLIYLGEKKKKEAQILLENFKKLSDDILLINLEILKLQK